MDEWVKKQYCETYCDDKGQLVAQTINLDTFCEHLKSRRPEEAKEITRAVKRLHRKLCSDLCRDLPIDSDGRFLDIDLAQQRLQKVRIDLKDRRKRKAIIKRVQDDNIFATMRQQQSTGPTMAQTTGQPLATSTTAAINGLTHSPKDKMIDRELYQWIESQYLSTSFTTAGFMGWNKFCDALIRQKPQLEDQITLAISYLRMPGHSFSLENPQKVLQAMVIARKRQGGSRPAKLQPAVNLVDDSASKRDSKFQLGSPISATPSFTFTASPSPTAPIGQIKPLSLAPTEQIRVKPSPANRADVGAADKSADLDPDSFEKRLQQLNLNGSSAVTPASSGVTSAAQGTPRTATSDFSHYSQLLTRKKKSTDNGNTVKSTQRDIKQAPLLSGSVILQHAHDLVPQYGLLGCLTDQVPSESASQMFLNTNVPMSTFICGVQGSGKSHTTSCILENAVIPSTHLGQLEKPISTLVFSYGEWSSGGAGFNISEATYLAAPSKMFPGHQVKRITVLTSPSNLAINSLYQDHPNVRIIPFKLRANTLDIGALRTLMAVDEKSSVPLYMAKVESILRSIAAKSKDGSLDYTKFKQALKLEKFDPTQTNMLEMRLNLLESFLDLTDKAPQPDYLPGEVTIMDLSDAFISSNTACILFKLGLERFLQSRAPGKLVVLDEAHKYMLNTPGSKVLTEYLTSLIRLQRHQGARIVISTQEPTVSTNLIALCSVTIIHRFTSPAWYNALKKHINAMDDDQKIMHDIEGLETGEALVYAPNAVLGKKEDGTLIKATGRLLKLNIRDRVTLDGGESIMAI